jgi:hypothetical protein
MIVAVLAVSAGLSNVVFPGGPDSSDSDPLNEAAILACYVVIAVLLMLVGARGYRRAGNAGGGFRAGSGAGLVLALGVTSTFLLINNVFFDVVSKQYDKRMAFAHSGWTSMRAYVTTQQLIGGAIMIPVGLILGGLLGCGAELLRTLGRARHND